MTAKIIQLADWRKPVPDTDQISREQRQARRVQLMRARLIQEAVDEAIMAGAPCDYESIMKQVDQWENMLAFEENY